LLGGGYILLVGAARLVETVHSLTDVLGGVATGVAMTLGLALAITQVTRQRQR
jgi:membrane-associated phospholipid phosphatase